MKPKEAAETLRKIAASIDSSKRPVKELVARDIKRLLAAVTAAPSNGAAKTQQEWEALFYPGMTEAEGSQAFWSAFKDLGWVDWTPVSDPKVAEAKMREMFADGRLQAAGPHSVEKAVKELRYNYKSYKSYEPKYIDGTINDG